MKPTKRDLKFFALGVLSLFLVQVVVSSFQQMYEGFYQEWKKDHK